MKTSVRMIALGLISVSILVACQKQPALSPDKGFGEAPVLPPPNPAMVVKIAKAVGWAEGQTPVAAKGLKVSAFAKDLDHPRWLYVLPNGDILVAETAQPPKSEDAKGFKGWIANLLMTKAGAIVKSANQITLLRDANGDGIPELRKVFLSGLNSPFGMALVGQALYVANTDAIMAFDYQPGATEIGAKGKKLVDLPAGPRNHHWTKNILASPDGTKLYATVGSNSNVGENGMDAEEGRAAIWEIDLATGKHRIFASGLRNPNGLAWQPQSGALWTTVNERDEIGNDLVPDYMTSVQDGGFYGWPYSYYGQIVDERVSPQRPDLVAKAIKPDYALGAHTASLGLAFYTAKALPQAHWGGAFIGQHGSWNRNPVNGYQVLFVPFANGKPSGKPQAVLTGFLDAKGQALGRPAGVAVDQSGAVLVADDVGNAIWRITSGS
jgi:glucose/arabinose dehydrogenase